MASKEGKVVFDDIEKQEGYPGNSEGSNNNSTELSIVGSLPNNENDSDRSVNSGTNDFQHQKGILGTSILKKRGSKNSNLKRSNSKSSYSMQSGTSRTSKMNHNGSIKTHSTGGSSGGSSHYSPHAKATPRHVWYGRWLFFVLLCMVAAVLGYLTYTALSDNENYLADCVFVKVAEHAIYTISNNQVKKKLGMDSMGSVIGSSGSNTEDWPFVTQSDYETIAHNIIDVSKGCNIAYGPILTPDQVPDFEAYAEDYYQNSRPEPFPNGTGIKVEDRVAVWAMDGETGMPFHDDSGATAWESKHPIIVPLYQHPTGPSPKLMFNLHASPLMGKTIEDMMECAEETKESIRLHELQYANETEDVPPVPSLKDCTMVTELAHNKTSFVQKEPMGPGASMMQPIFPANDKTNVSIHVFPSFLFCDSVVFVSNVCVLTLFSFRLYHRSLPRNPNRWWEFWQRLLFGRKPWWVSLPRTSMASIWFYPVPPSKCPIGSSKVL